LAWFGLALWAACTSSCAPAAERYPERTITIVMGISKGGITDIIARAYADAVSKELGQAIVIDNRPSETGEEAAAFVQHASPDGYTLLVFSGAQHMALPQMRSVQYEPLTGFSPVTPLFTMVNFLAVPANSPVRTANELIRLSFAQGALRFGSSGVGSTSHLTASRMALDFASPMVPVHHAGAAPVVAELVAGQLDFALVSYAVANPYVADGRLRLLAVDADKRWPDFPDLPTMFEERIYLQRVASWFALAAPKDTPEAVLQKLYAAFAKAAQDPEIVQALRDNGALPASATPAETRVMMVKEGANSAIVAASLNPH
jgi:tripartite-type tricarboxylate transporter receptor subunit TctC